MQKFPSRGSRGHGRSAEAPSDRREHARHVVSVPVVIDVDDESFECHICNVASGGAYLTPRLELDVGRRVKVQPANARVCATADVLRVEHDGIGIRFDDRTLGAIVAGFSRRVAQA